MHGTWRSGGSRRETSPTALRPANLRRVLGMVRPYWRETGVILACLGMSAALGLAPPLLLRTLFDSALPQKDLSLLNLLALAMVGAAVAGGLIGVLQSYLNNVVSHGIMFTLRNTMYQRLQAMSLGFYTHHRTGEMMSRITSDVNGVQGVISGTLLSAIRDLITFASTLALMFALSWQLALLALGVLPFLILPTQRVGTLRRRLRMERQQRSAEMTSLMQETLSIGGTLVTQGFNREELERSRFQGLSWEVMRLNLREALVGRWFYMAMGVITALGPALLYWYGGRQVIGDELSVGTVVAFVALVGRLYGPATGFASLHVDIMASLAHFERIFQYLDLEPDIREMPSAIPLDLTQGHVRFDAVSFSYVPERRALEDVSFEVQPGQLAALVGPSGAGKTTVTYLLPRFYDVSAGRVLLDGHDVRHLTLGSLRGHIGMVTQEPILFHASIRDNLLLAKPEAHQEELEAACRTAQIHDFIQDLPWGYDTIAGEQGYRLSGGEKQRLALARVVLRDPPILVLDEATAFLDSESEQAIREALEPLMRDRTTLVIAHRLSTILAADVVLVLDQGRLVEQGAHAQLLRQGGLYARLYETQFAPPLATQTDGHAPRTLSGG